MQRFHVKRGDPVVVISGSHRGKEGKIGASPEGSSGS